MKSRLPHVPERGEADNVGLLLTHLRFGEREAP